MLSQYINWISVQCTLCIKWTIKRCSGVRGDLSLVTDGFRGKRCDGTIKATDQSWDPVMDGETYECVIIIIIYNICIAPYNTIL